MTKNVLNFELRTAKGILRVSLPLMGAMVGNLLMMLIDRICLARYSNETLAASGPAIFTAMTIVAFFSSTVAISRSYVAQAYGRAGRFEAGREAALGIVIGLVAASLLIIMAPFIATIPFLSSRPPNIVQLESEYLVWAARFGGVMALNVSLSSYFNGVGKTTVAFVIGLVGQLVDCFMTIGLVFGKFGLPELGMRGSAIGTFVGTVSMLLCYIWFLSPEVRLGFKHMMQNGVSSLISNVALRLRRGIASGTAAGIDELGNTAFVWIIAILGPVALAANNVNLTLNYLGIIPIIGLGVGCSVLCGKAIGENDYVSISKILSVTLIIDFFYVIAISFFQIVTPLLLLRPFGLSEANTEMTPMAIITARVLWTYSASFVFSMTGAAVLESFGLTRYLFNTRLLVMWAMSVPLIYVTALGNRGNAGFLPYLWVIGSVFEAIIGGIYFWRIRRAIHRCENRLVLNAAA